MSTEHLDDDIDWNNSGNPSFQNILNVRLSRRSVLRGAGSAATLLSVWGLGACRGSPDLLATAASTTPSSTPAAASAATFPAQSQGRITTLSFAPVNKSRADEVRVPEGYLARVIYALGDPLRAHTPAYKNDGTDTDFEHRAGDHHDGIEYFGLSAEGRQPDAQNSQRGLLAMNHEALTSHFLHVHGASPLPRPADQSDKEIAAHGVSIVEVRQSQGQWSYAQDSIFNRRITPLTPVMLSGVARGHDLMKTMYSPEGVRARGTLNNCGTGQTPWGTFLTGEENWAGYFTRNANDDQARAAAQAKHLVALKRYGRPPGAPSRHGWETSGPADHFARWNISATGSRADGVDDYRHELNTMGYIVEIDPYAPEAPIKKRTSLGRFAHESAAFGLVQSGRPLAVYMGDDSRGEYIYKFVSKALWHSADAQASDRVATGDKYLDQGTLYVARFNDDGSGTWEALTLQAPGIQSAAKTVNYAFSDAGDLMINARLAADALGATKMDRPEWCAVHPDTGEVYVSLTNNSQRKLEPGAGEQGVNASSPRAYSDKIGATAPRAQGNPNGHIIRLRETDDASTATTFTWDVYLFGARSTADSARVNLSALSADQDFSSPDGLWFSRSTGLCWIQTDDGAYTDVTNCMMLAGVPGRVGDGRRATVQHTRHDGSTLTIDTPVGRQPKSTQLRRFLVGPVDCEITGCTETPDGTTLFVNIQHPGEEITAAQITDPKQYTSHWPANAGYGPGGAQGRPRSATVAITKIDNQRVGA